MLTSTFSQVKKRLSCDKRSGGSSKHPAARSRGDMERHAAISRAAQWPLPPRVKQQTNKLLSASGTVSNNGRLWQDASHYPEKSPFSRPEILASDCVRVRVDPPFSRPEILFTLASKLTLEITASSLILIAFRPIYAHYNSPKMDSFENHWRCSNFEKQTRKRPSTSRARSPKSQFS